MKFSIAFHAVALDVEGDAPEWVHLIPAGEFSGRDGRGPYALDAGQVAAAFARRGIPLVIDYEHQTYAAPDNGQPAPAAGWVTALDTREDGLWGRVEWTQPAAGMIAAREYRYLSPVFSHDAESGRITELLGAGLTNQPNLFLTALNRRATLSINREGAMMEDILERLRYLFNLPTLADEAAIVAELDRLRARLAAPEIVTAKERLGVAADARLPPVIDALATHRFAEPGAEGFVPRSEYERLAAELYKVREAEETRRVDAEVQAALAAHKIAPANVEWARAEARAGRLAGFVASAPAILETHATSGNGARPDKSTPNPLLADAERRAAK
ncbi:MAG: phage protease [Azoarcus sp.]|jgi:phage I-like protein|nr:phage protease [Azoarcus sp.]